MKYVFFGTPRFAEIILEDLVYANLPPITLVCNPDRPVGRKKIITPPETKHYLEQNLPEGKIIEIIQPEKINDDFIEKLRDMEADFFIVAAYAKILPQKLLDIPRLGTIGVHPSLLPKYRGASPIQSALLGGEKETGVSLYQMDKKTDHGNIFITRTLPLAGDEIYLQLEESLAKMAGELLIEFLPAFTMGTVESCVQDETMATFTKKFTTEDGFVSPENLHAAQDGNREKAETIFRKIRALNPEPGVWTIKDNKRIKLLEAKIIDNALRLTITQREGEKAKQI